MMALLRCCVQLSPTTYGRLLVVHAASLSLETFQTAGCALDRLQAKSKSKHIHQKARHNDVDIAFLSFRSSPAGRHHRPIVPSCPASGRTDGRVLHRTCLRKRAQQRIAVLESTESTESTALNGLALACVSAPPHSFLSSMLFFRLRDARHQRSNLKSLASAHHLPRHQLFIHLRRIKVKNPWLETLKERRPSSMTQNTAAPLSHSQRLRKQQSRRPRTIVIIIS
ncbi:hypothetical protein SCHPADRAFT_694006 [Schizopora paradoxa]|uniref:Uncharacterized protein n=1 Tax=Schizopora paradoxa TaxID=27342 RepID=A0A0H2R3B3_9AGAM|nr:hypothetical protein SCHPADRAFT_694006 [Schizopora paradoxa]